MFKKIVLTTAVCLIFTGSLQAQENAAATTEAAAEVPAPTEITPEQKIAAQVPMMKNIRRTAQSSEPREAKRMVDAVNTVEKIQVRRVNRTAAPEAQAEYKAEAVNVRDKEAVATFLEEKMLAPTEKAFSDAQAATGETPQTAGEVK